MRHFSGIGVLAAVFIIVGCGPAETKQAIVELKAHGDARMVHEVSTAAELINVIGPNRIIQLAPGEYNLTGVERRKLEHVRWEETIDGEYDLIIHDCPGLAIRGPQGEQAHVMIYARYPHVLNFQRCDGLELTNLRAGHVPKPGYCTGGVFHIQETAGATIGGCTLYGCGTVGLTLEKAAKLRVVRTVIEHCTYGIIDAFDCDGLVFEDCIFRCNRQFTGFDFRDCQGVSFLRCQIHNNVLGGLEGPLFKTNLTSEAAQICFRDGIIFNNAAVALAAPENMLVVWEGSPIGGNSWQAPPEVQAKRGKKTPTAAGGWLYVVPVGEVEFADCAQSVYGDAKMADVLKRANPEFEEPLMPDTLIECPPKK